MNDKLYYENMFLSEGYKYICGIDEVGRGCLFGAVVATCVIMPLNNDDIIVGVEDSKKLSDKKRRELFDIITKKAICYSTVAVGVEEIDKINIYNASKKAMIEAVNLMKIKPDILLVDAMKLNIGIRECSIIKGDMLSYSIAAASIIAKVTRDNMMIDFSKVYPHYALDKNKGYGTKKHIDAIKTHGITKEHRKTFAPISDIIGSKNERDKSIF